MTRPILIALMFLSFGTSLCGQSRLEIIGTRNFEEYSYDRAIKYFEEIDEKSIDVKRKLAISYFKTQDYDQSEWYYTQLVESPDAVSEDYFNYSQVLAIQEKYPESVRWMYKYQEGKADDSRASSRLQNPTYYEDLVKEENGYEISNLSINTNETEFGASFYKEDVVFVSSRSGVEAIVRKWNWNQMGFLDIFQADMDTTDYDLSDPQRHHKKFNKKYHEGPASFNEEGDMMVFTRNNYKKRSSSDEVNLEMYESRLVDGQWQKPKPLPYNNREYSVGHGTLSKDGNTLFFISDKPGSYGGTDLYVAHRNENGDWGEAIQFGDDINTEGNEMFPYMHTDSILFFSSNGHPGIGGLDIFFIDLRYNGLRRVGNMNSPINSSKDDFAFIMNDERTKGYFSSNRVGGKGDDDIYAFIREEPLKFYQLLRGKVIDQLGAVVPNTKVLMRNADGEVIAEAIADEKGQYMFEVEEDKMYSLIAEKMDYSRGLGKIETNTRLMEFNKDVMITKKPQGINLDRPMDMSAGILDFDDDKLIYRELDTMSPGLSILSKVRDIRTGAPISNAMVYLYDKLTGEETLMESPDNGDNTWLLDEATQSNMRYTIRIEKEGYQPMEFDFDTPENELGQHTFTTKLIPVLGPNEVLDIDMATLFEIGPIYFDLDKYNIRPDAAEELDKVVDLMRAKPNMVIELTAFTDCRASMTYNDRLSNNRAISTAKYIRKRIKNDDRVTGKGLGEKKLVNDCECEGEVVSDCSEEEHQRNRRTEFTILKM